MRRNEKYVRIVSLTQCEKSSVRNSALDLAAQETRFTGRGINLSPCAVAKTAPPTENLRRTHSRFGTSAGTACGSVSAAHGRLGLRHISTNEVLIGNTNQRFSPYSTSGAGGPNSPRTVRIFGFPQQTALLKSRAYGDLST